MALRPDPTDFESMGSYRTALDKWNAANLVLPEVAPTSTAALDPADFEQPRQYQTALVRQRLAGLTSADQEKALSLGIGLEEYARVKPQLDAQAANKVKQDAFMASPQVVAAVERFKANPTDRAAWEGLSGLLANAPVNFLQTGDPTARQAKFGRQEFLAGEAIHEKFPEISQQLTVAGERFNPQGGMLSMQNLGPALGVGAAALAPFALSAFAPAAAGVTGSAAAPFGFAGSTGVGASLANAAGIGTTALGTAGAAIPNTPGLWDNITNAFSSTPTPSTTTPTPATANAPTPAIAPPPNLATPTGAGTAAATGLGDTLLEGLKDPSVLGALAGGVTGAMNQVGAPTLMEPSRIARTPIEQDILAVTDPRIQRNVDLQAQERAARAGATGGTTSGEILRDQLQRQLGTESVGQNALNAMLSSYNLQNQQQTQENAFANQINAARLKQLTATTGTQDRNLSNVFGGALAGAQIGDVFSAFG